MPAIAMRRPNSRELQGRQAGHKRKPRKRQAAQESATLEQGNLTKITFFCLMEKHPKVQRLTPD